MSASPIETPLAGGRQARFFSSCAPGLEELLVAELRELGIEDARATAGGVQFGGSLEDAYRACLWSRVASRILFALAEVDARDADELYAGVVDLPWEQHIGAGATIAVDFIGTSEALRNTLFSARRVKDAVVDRLRAVTGLRPDVDVQSPDIRIVARLHRGKLALSIDLGGGAQHRRGYRSGTGAAPLKENLAAALLLRCGWPELAAAGGALYDPMCGSGTLLIEGALIAAGAAPGEWRAIATQKWRGHDAALWLHLSAQARELRENGLARLPPVFGADVDARVLEHAAANARAAGLGEHLRFEAISVAAQRRPAAMAQQRGLLICNPPYGERMGEFEALREVYADLGRLAREEFADWRIAVLTTEGPLVDCLDMRFERRYRFRNGPIDCRLLVHDPQSRIAVARAAAAQAPKPAAAPLMTDGAVMVSNRIRKNLRRLRGWLKQTGNECYRVYDADIPEYAVAVDRYGDWVHMAEYAAPSTIDAVVAQQRLGEARAAVIDALEVPADRVVLKTRSRQRGSEQYQRMARDNHFIEVREGPARLLVNLKDFLDTGLFIDHRPARRLIASLSPGASFLNLFCYTASATVLAALGGARETTSVDLSSTYLDWAQRNLILNGFRSNVHHLVRADCLRWLDEQTRSWDLVFLDPPSFSNSRRMQDTLDVQRDHVALVRSCMRVLAPGGTLLFSTNRRGFRLDTAALAAYALGDITEHSCDPDFTRKPVPHRLYRICHKDQ